MFKKFLNSILGNDDEKENPGPKENQPTYEQNNAASEDAGNDEETEYDPETLHGTHYTVEDFDAEVKSRTHTWVKSEQEDGETLSQQDIDNIMYNYRKDVYLEWNDADTDQLVRWQSANSMLHRGIATSGFVKADAGNSLLEPIHGISLKDYAAMAIKMSNGVDATAVIKAMGIDQAIWEELNTLWPQRMQEDSSFTVSTLYGQYFMEGDSHPKLDHLKAEISEEGQANLKKLKTDRYFYEELCGARQAAYEYGLDGAQWIQENYGISLGDFQAVAMEYMTTQNQNWNSGEITKHLDYQQQKQKEHAAKFAAEQGGNVADDIDF